MKKFISIITTGLLALALVAGAASVHAQTTGTGGTGTTSATSGTTGTTGTTGTVGAPNTGSGGDTVMNLAILVSTGAIAAGGAAYLLRTRRTA